jgi:hypothetical protein
VAPRPRLNAGERRKHLELWQRREAADKAFRAAQAHGRPREGGSKKDQNANVGPTLAHEILSDRSGIGFAFGGMHPGTLHAAGRLVKMHTIRYTIGRAGKYKLHVGLRNQAVALPGSPFSLTETPRSPNGRLLSQDISKPADGEKVWTKPPSSNCCSSSARNCTPVKLLVMSVFPNGCTA